MSGVTFREVMTGQLTLGTADPRAGYQNPNSVGFVVDATIDIPDLTAFLDDPNHRGGLFADVEVPRWGEQFGSRVGGAFGLFTPTEHARTTHMVYELPVTIDGRPHWIVGVKQIRVEAIWRLWPATTTLYTTVHEGRDSSGAVVGAGIVRLNLSGVLAMLATMRGTRARWPVRGWNVLRFLTFFTTGLVSTYLLRRRA